MADLYVMVGLPASGKSTWAKELIEQHVITSKYAIVSTDDLRQELLGDINAQNQNTEVFNEAYKRIQSYLKKGIDVYFDATNINYKKRMDIINRFKKYADDIDAIMIATPYEECIERNKKRERQVPEDVIKRMYMNFYVPQFFEGFDNITIIRNTNKFVSMEELKHKLNIPHDNPHHKLSVLEHSDYVYLDLEKKFGTCALTLAGYLHDIGKPFCKTFVNAKGETTEVAHYYNHEKVGAYDSILYTAEYGLEYQLYIAQLIQWHMLLHDPNLTEKTIKKHKNRFGDYFWKDLEELHRADLSAH